MGKKRIAQKHFCPDSECEYLRETKNITTLNSCRITFSLHFALMVRISRFGSAMTYTENRQSYGLPM
jgi:hypothetical protein